MPSHQLLDQLAHSQPSPSSPSSLSSPLSLSSLVATLLQRFLPDVHDPRYPRPTWQRTLRGVALLWWLPAITYLGDVATALVLQGVRGGLASLQNTQQLLHAALLDLVWARLSQQPWLVVPALGGTVALVLAGHWAERDTTRESRVLLLRAFHESPTHAGKAMVVGVWAARWLKTKLRSIALRVALGAGALVLGVALALVFGRLS